MRTSFAISSWTASTLAGDFSSGLSLKTAPSALRISLAATYLIAGSWTAIYTVPISGAQSYMPAGLQAAT